MSRRFRSQAFVRRQLELHLTKYEFAGLFLPGRIQNHLWLFSSLLCRSVSTKKSTFQDIFPCCISAVLLSVYSKIHESCKSEVKPQIKFVPDCAAKRCTPCEICHIYFASQPISLQTVFKSMRFRRLHDLETVSF